MGGILDRLLVGGMVQFFVDCQQRGAAEVGEGCCQSGWWRQCGFAACSSARVGDSKADSERAAVAVDRSQAGGRTPGGGP
jgi:hypothetical protein